MKRSWNGLYPVAALELLPEELHKNRMGFIRDKDNWAAVWKAFRPEQRLPRIDFKNEVIVFVKNVRFLNRIAVRSASVEAGTLTIHVRETRTARPISEHVYCAIVVVDRQGIKQLTVNGVTIPIDEPAAEKR